MTKAFGRLLFTPADDDQSPQVVLVGEEGHEDETVQVEPLHQDPVMVCGQEIKKECNGDFTASLRTQNSMYREELKINQTVICIVCCPLEYVFKPHPPSVFGDVH